MKVQILMSTYNGEKFLEEQIESILNQCIGIDNLFILIRDDGSNDSTIKILENYKNIYPTIIDYYEGENLGPCYSFFDLVKNADLGYDYFAFSDQDDFWLPNKLEMAIKKLDEKGDNIPLLYSSKYTIVDNNLNEIKGQTAKKVNFTSFENSLIENVATGCTEVFNKEMLVLLNKVNESNTKGFFMHDWVLYMLATSLGQYIYDENSYLLYRQHENNVLGASRGKFNNWQRKIKLFFKYNSGNIIRKNATAFYEVYGNHIDSYSKSLIECFVIKNFKNSLKLSIHKEIKRQKFIDEIIFRLLIISNFI